MEEMADSGPSSASSSNSIEAQTPDIDNQCCICMRKAREFIHLCLVNGGGNSLFSLLCDDQDDSPDGSKGPTRLIICWECDAIMSKIVSFRQQACKAQTRLSSIAEGRTAAQNAFVLIPPIAGARGAGSEAILEYRTQTEADPSQPLLRIVRYVLSDGTSTLPRPDPGSQQSSLLDLLEGINH